MALNVKKGDTVLVIAGKDKGKTGKVLVAMPADNSVVVAGVNIVAKHKKPRSAQDKGGIIKKENKIDASNVQIVCPSCSKATRVAHKENNGKKERFCKKCGASLDVVVKKTTKADSTKTATKKAEPKQTSKVANVAKKTESKTAEKSTVAKKTATSKTTTTKSTTAKASTTAKTAEKKTTTKSTTKKVESK